jgi:hypothetical protein
MSSLQKDEGGGMMKRICWILIASACLILCIGCDDDTTRPSETADIAISFELKRVSGTNTQDLVARVEVKHKGGAAVEYDPRCGRVIVFQIRDEQGNKLIIYDPSYEPVCPPWNFTLRPGESLRRELLIDGHIWDNQGTEISLAQGRYTLFVDFSYSIPGSGQTQYWSNEIDFNWE